MSRQFKPQFSLSNNTLGMEGKQIFYWRAFIFILRKERKELHMLLILIF